MQLVFCAMQEVLTAQDKVCYLTKEQKIIWCYNLKKSLSHQWWFQKAERSALLWNRTILGSTLHWLHKWFKTCLALRFSFLMIEEITKCPYYRWQWKKNIFGLFCFTVITFSLSRIQWEWIFHGLMDNSEIRAYFRKLPETQFSRTHQQFWIRHRCGQARL